ncbi:hypothetical protein MESS4_230012 [Mesorhizobium sp. STM 4661]|nr:hypothetical protein MESS4_230012 [Mesorhizobium sp. STM 4661]
MSSSWRVWADAKELALTLRLDTPLWPAGHLPRKGGDWQLRGQRFFSNVGDWRKQNEQPISPLAGEMSGRTEGGVTERSLRDSVTGIA